MNEIPPSESPPSNESRRRAPLWQRLLPWLITLACFAYLYSILNRTAAAQESALLPYLLQIFERVSWWQWLGMMVPYTMFFFILDTFIIWKVINWFNVKINYMGILPIRASAFILSLLNEQVGKGAIALYLNRRDGIPGWEVASSMLFVMFCEFYYLTTWATVGVLLEWQKFPAVLHSIPWIALGAVIFFACFHLYFSGRILKGVTLREKPIFRAFRQAQLWQYLAVIAIRSPVILSAVMIYSLALGLFGVEVSFSEMLGYLPVILFGAVMPGPMRSVAIVLWVTLFPDNPGKMSAFGFVQHNFFIFFNASIGLLFLRRANRELFGDRKSLTTEKG